MRAVLAVASSLAVASMLAAASPPSRDEPVGRPEGRPQQGLASGVEARPVSNRVGARTVSNGVEARSFSTGVEAALQGGPTPSPRLPETSDRIVDYTIDVELDAVRKQLDGHERLTWRNPSSEPVADLWFHLYLNAFKDRKSTFMRESGGQLRGDRMTEGKWGRIDVKSIALVEQANATPVERGAKPAGGRPTSPRPPIPDPDTRQRQLSLTFEHPDDDNADDRTVARAILREPVPPGGSVTLDIVFRAYLPQVFARSGYVRDYYLVGQWFPKLGVYEPAGMRGRATGGWNCHQYHATSEFYADYGRFRVNITVPSRFVVGATGQRVDKHDNGDGTTTRSYEQADVHDFAWTADPDFVEMRRIFSASRDVTPAAYREAARLLGRSLDDVRLCDVEVILLLQPAHLSLADRHFAAVFAGLRRFGLWYGRYPYRTLSVVDPAYGAEGSGGMEYPTFITAGTSILANVWPFRDLAGPEGVTVHEFGHQFWYGMVGNNEFEEAWLDEGIDSYSTGRVMEIEFPRSQGEGVPFLRLGERDMLRVMNGPDSGFHAVLQPAWSFGDDYGFFAYAKPEIVLRTLENMLGRETMARVMRTYQERWRFRHPSSRDFFDTASAVAGRDLTWFFDQTIRQAKTLDYEVARATTVPVEAARKESEPGGGEKRPRRASAATTPIFESTVIVRRRGEIVIPVDIGLKFEGRPVERIRWDGQSREVRYTFTRPERLSWAQVDPEGALELDVDSLNNSRTVSSDNRVPAKWTATLVFFVQNLLAAVGV
jgi:hypothetical protein